MTRAAVLAWQVENDHATTGNLDIDPFKSLLANSKEMRIGRETQKKRAQQAGAARTIETGAEVGVVGLVAEGVGQMGFNVSLWSHFMEGLNSAVAAVGKVKTLGLAIDVKMAGAMVLGVTLIALVRWARQARGK